MREIELSSVFVCFAGGWSQSISLGGAMQQSEPDETRREMSLYEREALSLRKKRSAYSSFLKERQDRLLGIACRVLRDREAALDILQEVALVLYQRWEEVDQEQNPDGWLYRVTVHACYGWLRKRAIRDIGSDALERADSAAIPASQEGYLRTQQFQVFLGKALERLSEQERIAFVLRDIEQRSGKEIAELMACQATTARGYYFSARKKLASHITTQAPEWLSLLGQGGEDR